MSTLITSFTTESAQKYNLKTVDRFLTTGDLPEAALLIFPDLEEHIGSPEFAKETLELQKYLQFTGKDLDGKFGRKTWNTLNTNFDPINVGTSYVVWESRRIPLEESDSYQIHSFDELQEIPGSIAMDLHPFGHFSRRNAGDLNAVVLHWGGLDPVHLYNVMGHPECGVSTHFGIGLMDDTPTVIQYLDLTHRAWHAGWINQTSIGVDICQQPSFKWASLYEERGYKLTRRQNRTGRGQKSVLSLEPRIAAAAREFIFNLTSALNIPQTSPDNHDVQNKAALIRGDWGVVGHHHVNARKWDMACWWGELFDGTVLG